MCISTVRIVTLLLQVVSGILPDMLFVSSSDALFGFTFYAAKLKSNFLNHFLSLTAFARVTSFLSLSLSL